MPIEASPNYYNKFNLDVGQDMKAFIDQYKMASQSSLMQDPAVARLINGLVGRIVLLSDSVQSLNTPQEIAQIATVNRADSNTICDVGQGNSASGISCD
jgi:hypothetical protein